MSQTGFRWVWETGNFVCDDQISIATNVGLQFELATVTVESQNGHPSTADICEVTDHIISSVYSDKPHPHMHTYFNNPWREELLF